MNVTGTVTRRRRQNTAHGSTYISVWIAREGTHDIKLTWLHPGGPVPDRGQRITVEGMPLMLTPKRGCPTSNVSLFKLTIHDPEGAVDGPPRA